MIPCIQSAITCLDSNSGSFLHEGRWIVGFYLVLCIVVSLSREKDLFGSMHYFFINASL